MRTKIPALREALEGQFDTEHALIVSQILAHLDFLDDAIVRLSAEIEERIAPFARFPGETSCLSLVWAVLDLFFSHASNGATFTDVDRQHLYRIKYQQADPDTIDEEVTAA